MIYSTYRSADVTEMVPTIPLVAPLEQTAFGEMLGVGLDDLYEPLPTEMSCAVPSTLLFHLLAWVPLAEAVVPELRIMGR